MRPRHLAIALTLALTTTACPARAQWPGWGGSGRDFKVNDAHLANTWPDGGPPRLWEREIGDSYSALSVEGDLLYTSSRKGQQECIVALDRKSGRTVWEHSFAETRYEGLSKEFGEGPNTTPLVHDGCVYGAGMGGQLYCLESRTGKPIWSRDLMKEDGATPLTWGYAASPLVHEGRLIVLAGGPGSSVLALDPKTGVVLWKSQSLPASYASPIVIRVDGQDQIVAFLASAAIGLDPSSGKLLWSQEHETDYGINACSPVWDAAASTLFLSSGYNNGSRVVRLARKGDKTEIEELWFSRRLKVQFGNAVQVGDRIYFCSGHSGQGFLVGIEAATGSILWRERGLPRASVLHADGKLLVLDEDGKLTLGVPGDDGFEELATCQILDKVAWTPPTLVGSTLYLRDREKVLALDLGPSSG